jgi:uncharacterized protein (TIGR02421 family)
MDKSLKLHKKLDRRLVQVVKTIEILDLLSWPVSETKLFLKSWTKKQPKLPTVVLPLCRYKEERRELRAIMKLCDQKSPIGRFIFETAKSYFLATDMLENVGKPRFTKISGEIYGYPNDSLGSGSLTTLGAAKHFLQGTKKYINSCSLNDTDYCLLPEYVATEIRKKVKRFFKHHKISVETDPKLAGKASAGITRIRIRSFTCFAHSDIAQLLQHEAFVHMLTLINGREQPNLKTLGLKSPRTTCTQEGLAIFAEMITNAIELNRLRRISLRVKAIDMGLNGANFIEVFKFFLKSGQNEVESFQSSARIFRGGNANGKIVFTKDLVYLRGFVEIHTFLQRAIQEGKVLYPHALFVGRLCSSDVKELEPYIESGFIKPPMYEPDWLKNRSSLLAFLLYSALTSKLRLHTSRLPIET